ncbi:MAG: VOC family protein [Bacteroidota bacterium]
MTDNKNDHRIDYIEFNATNIEATKKFYSAIFGWIFTDYGPDYVSFKDGRINGGFTKVASIKTSNPLVVLYSKALEKSLAAVSAQGGKITKQPFSFPGGRRFHFLDPNGNELAIWSEK